MSSRRISALDGIRGVAAVGIVVYHIRDGRPGGLGQAVMELFFALSGYLITGVLLDTFRSQSSGRFRTFYLRRAFRLLPALYALIAVGIVAKLVGLNDAPDTVPMGIASALYVGNFWEMIRQTFDDRPFQPLWSLAVEEQFYLVWPVLVFAAMRFRRPIRKVAVVAAGVAAVSLGVRVYGATHGWSLVRMRNGLDTRLFALALGAACRSLIPPGKLRQRKATVLGVGAGLVWIGSIVAAREYVPRTFGTWWVLSAVAAAVLVTAVASGGLAGRALGIRPLGFFGAISYSLYLAHPLAIDMAHHFKFTGIGFDAVAGTLAFAGACVSYVLIERPMRDLGRRLTRAPSPPLPPNST